jgi:predicted GNAT family acetyltransferase
MSRADSVEIVVRDAPENKRFEIWAGDELAGFTVYQPRPEYYSFVHTEIDPAFGGRGLASILIKRALDEMRARGIAILPICPFVLRYISRHHDYLDLVPADQRARFDLPAAEPTS